MRTVTSKIEGTDTKTDINCSIIGAKVWTYFDKQLKKDVVCIYLTDGTRDNLSSQTLGCYYRYGDKLIKL